MATSGVLWGGILWAALTQLRVWIWSAADDETQHAGLLTHGDQGVTGLLAERLEVGDGGAIGGEHARSLPRRHGPEGAVGANTGNGQFMPLTSSKVSLMRILWGAGRNRARVVT